jgi:diguanylate cyclase (GGDEF)-like protein
MKNAGFSTKIKVYLISFVALNMIVLSIVMYRISYTQSEKLILKNLEDVSRLNYQTVQISVDSSIENYLRSMTEGNLNAANYFYGSYINGESGEEEAIKSLFDELSVGSFGETGYSYAIDSEGIVVYHPYLEKGTDLSEYDFVQQQIGLKQGYLEYEWKNPGEEKIAQKSLYMTYFEEWDLIISVSAYKDEFSFLVDVEDFREPFLGVTIGKSGYSYIMDGKGKLIVHPFQEGENISDIQEDNGRFFIREILGSLDGTITYPWVNPTSGDLVEKIVVYKYFETMDWYICSGVFVDEIYSPASQVGRQFAIVFIVVLSITSIIGIKFSKVFLRPIEKLIEAMKRIRLGDYNFRLENDRDDIIGELVDIFNDNVAQIDVYTNRLEQANKDLESKVLIRTKELEDLSNQDPMTKLFNRRKMNSLNSSLWKQSLIDKTHISFIMLDIDNFKNFNDMYGHLMGDEVIVAIADILQSVFKRESDFVSRFGGEEFLVVLKDSSAEICEKLVTELLAAVVTENIEHKGGNVEEFVTVSIGAYTVINDGTLKLKEVIKRTDDLMYLAKEKGRNRFEISHKK